MGWIGTEVPPEDLLAQIRAGSAPAIVDVRSSPEYSSGHVPGAIHLPFWSALFRARRIPAAANDPVIVYCGHGPRAMMAARALRFRGFRDIRFLRGHMASWSRARLPIER